MSIPYCRVTKRKPFTYESDNGRSYVLHAKEHVLRNGNATTIYYFKRDADYDHALSRIPRGWTVGTNRRNGLPYLKRDEDDAFLRFLNA